MKKIPEVRIMNKNSFVKQKEIRDAGVTNLVVYKIRLNESFILNVVRR